MTNWQVIQVDDGHVWGTHPTRKAAEDQFGMLTALGGREDFCIVRQKNADDLTWAATARCPCGAGLAYDKSCQIKGPQKWPYNGYWDCSAILLGTFSKDVTHTDKLLFAFYEIKDDTQPSANGRTTRP